MTAPLRHSVCPALDPLDRGPDGRINWRRPPETGPQRSRRIVGDVLAVVIGLVLTSVAVASTVLSLAG